VRPVAGRETRLESAGNHLLIVAGAPIAAHGKTTVGGHVAVSAAVDLARFRRRLQAVAVGAWLTGAGAPIAIVDAGQATSSAEAASLSIPLSVAPDGKPAPLALAATPIAAAQPGWMLALQIAFWAAAAVSLGACAVRRRSA
jgi:hypothetical protein